MYVVIDPVSESEIGRYLSLRFVKEINFDEQKAYEPVTFEEAEAIFLDRVLYQIDGRNTISVDAPVVKVIEYIGDTALMDLYSSGERSTAYIDYLSAMTGIDLPDVEEN